MSSTEELKDLEVLKQITKSTEEAFFMYNLSSKKLEYLNDNFEKIWEIDKNYIVNNISEILSTIVEDDRELVMENYEDFIKDKNNKTLEFRIQIPDKSIKWIATNSFKIKHQETEQFIACFAEDITPRKERENKAAKFNTKKNALLDLLNHEFKGSLGMINALNDQVLEQAKTHDLKNIQEYIQLSKKICTHNIDLIRSLLNEELLESAELELIRKRLDLVENLNIMLVEYKDKARDIKKNFHFNSSKDSVYVHVDEVLFTQVFNILISNAVKFTHENGNIWVNIEEKESMVVVSVKDDGIGIPKNMQPYLFDRFTKAKRAGLREEESIGLGMSILRRIIEIHGGKVWVESDEKNGATFFVEIQKHVTKE